MTVLTFVRRVAAASWLPALAVLAFGAAAALPAAAAEAGYFKRWDWNANELSRIRKLRKSVTEVERDRYFVETAHFRVTTEIDEKFTAETAMFMELYYRQFIEMFYFPDETQPAVKRNPKTDADARDGADGNDGADDDDEPITVFGRIAKKLDVWIYGSQRAYMAGDGMIGARGHYSPGQHRVSTYMEGRNVVFAQCYHPVVQHEAAHAMLQSLAGDKPIPAWFNEGVACFFEFWDFRSNARPAGADGRAGQERLRRNQLSFRNRDLASFLKDNANRLPRLRDVVALETHARWDPDEFGRKTRANYAFAETAADFLFSAKPGRAALKTAVERLAAAKPAAHRVDGESVLDARLITPEEADKLQSAWAEHVRRNWNSGAREPSPENDPKKTSGRKRQSTY